MVRSISYLLIYLKCRPGNLSMPEEWAMFLECGECGCLVADNVSHARFHERLDRIENGPSLAERE